MSVLKLFITALTLPAISVVVAVPNTARAEDFDFITRTTPSAGVTIIRIDKPDIRVPSKA